MAEKPAAGDTTGEVKKATAAKVTKPTAAKKAAATRSTTTKTIKTTAKSASATKKAVDAPVKPASTKAAPAKAAPAKAAAKATPAKAEPKQAAEKKTEKPKSATKKTTAKKAAAAESIDLTTPAAADIDISDSAPAVIADEIVLDVIVEEPALVVAEAQPKQAAEPEAPIPKPRAPRKSTAKSTTAKTPAKPAKSTTAKPPAKRQPRKPVASAAPTITPGDPELDTQPVVEDEELTPPAALLDAESRLGLVIEQSVAKASAPAEPEHVEPVLVNDVLPAEVEETPVEEAQPELKQADLEPAEPQSAEDQLPEPEPIVEPLAAVSRPQTAIIQSVPTPGAARRSTATAVTVVLTAIVFMGVGLLLGSRSNQTGATYTPTTVANSTVTTAPVVSPPLGANLTPTTAATTVTTGATTANGNTVTRLSGSANRQSALFDLGSGPVQIRYNTTGGSLTVRLLPQSGTDSGDDFLCTSACDREADLVKDAGKYYLDVQSSGGDWNIQVTK